MESTVIFWLFSTFLIGGGMLVLLLGYRSIEEQRAREEEQREAQELRAVRDMAAMPRFFAGPTVTDSLSAGPVLDDALLADLESYVRAEQVLAAQFVNEPSVDSLYRQSRPSAFLH